MSSPAFAIVDTPSLRMDELKVRRYPSDDEVRHVVDFGPIRINLSSAEAANLGTLLIESCAAVTE